MFGAGPEDRNCLISRTSRGGVDHVHRRNSVRIVAARVIDHRFVQVPVRGMDHDPAGDIELREQLLHPPHRRRQLRRVHHAAVLVQGAPVPAEVPARQQHRVDQGQPVAGQQRVVDVTVVGRRMQAVDQPRRRYGGQNLPADQLHAQRLAAQPGAGTEDSALARHPVDLLAGDALRQTGGGLGGAIGGHKNRRVRRRGPALSGCPAGRGGRREGLGAVRRCGRGRGGAVGPVIAGPGLRVAQDLIGQAHAAELGGVPAMVRMGGACGPAVRGLDLLCGGIDRQPQGIVVGWGSHLPPLCRVMGSCAKPSVAAGKRPPVSYRGWKRSGCHNDLL